MSAEPFKSCLFCHHCEFEEGGALSDITWESPSINCSVGENTFCGSDRKEFAKWSRKAETCESYSPDL